MASVRIGLITARAAIAPSTARTAVIAPEAAAVIPRRLLA